MGWRGKGKKKSKERHKVSKADWSRDTSRQAKCRMRNNKNGPRPGSCLGFNYAKKGG